MYYTETPLEDRGFYIGIADSITAIGLAIHTRVLEEGLGLLLTSLANVDLERLRYGLEPLNEGDTWQSVLEVWEARAIEHGLNAYAEDGVYYVEDEEGAPLRELSRKFDRIMGDPGMAHRINAGSSQNAGRVGFLKAVHGAMQDSRLSFGHLERDADVILTLGNYAGWFPDIDSFIRSQLEDLEVPRQLVGTEWEWVKYSVDYGRTITALMDYRPFLQFAGHYFWDE